ncbi:MAG: MarP family serine protease [Actinomycetota bacterium]|nr:MarP family serine protease [Actinomycetota bacterium]
MNPLDLVLVAVLVGYAASGYWQGFLVGASATIGLVLGGAAGVVAVPLVLADVTDSLAVSLGALGGVLLLASFGQALGAFVGRLVRSRVRWRPARAVDALGGAALTVVAALLIVWALGYVVSGARLPWLGDQVRSSLVLSKVDEAVPDAAADLLGALDELVGSDLFPRFLEPFVAERIAPVPPPDGAVSRDPDVRRAAASVVRIVGEAEQCSRTLAGSGFAYAPGRVMTNAHVVAGVSSLAVGVGRDQAPAAVVLFDPDLDLAVLAVDGLDVPALRFDRSGRAGDGGAVLGYPENGPFTSTPARIRAQQRLRSPDIYAGDTSEREVFSVRSSVRPGNSGGPLVSGAGRVYGVVFAASVADGQTGYALTADQVARSAARGARAAGVVSTGECA